MEKIDLPSLVDEMNATFRAFRTRNDQKIESLENNYSRLQGEIEDAHVKLTAVNPAMSTKPDPAEDNGPSAFAATGMTLAQLKEYYNREANNDGEDPNNAPNLADVFKAAAGMRTHPGAIKALSEGTDSDGGYSVPSLVMPKILDALHDQSALLRSGASLMPWPFKLDQGAKSVMQAVVSSLPTPRWRDELSAVTESDPSFRGVNMTPQDLSCIVRCSRELLMDSPDIDRSLRTAATAAFAAELDRAGLVGSGTPPEPLGIANTAGINTAAQVGTALEWSDVLAGYQSILDAEAPAPTALILAPGIMVGLAGQTDTTGQPLRRPPLLDKMSLVSSARVPTDLGAGTDESIAFLGNFASVRILMREKISVQVLREKYADKGEIGFALHMRVDIAPLYPMALATITAVK